RASQAPTRQGSPQLNCGSRFAVRAVFDGELPKTRLRTFRKDGRMKQRFSGSALVIAGLVSAVACSQSGKGTSSSLTAPTPESAAAVTTRGNGAPAGKLVYKWNLIGTPHEYTGGCGSGGRIFVERGDKNATIKIQDAGAGGNWAIVDCNGTGGNTALMDSVDLGTFDVYARILGKPGGTLNVCANVVSDAGDPLCLLGTIKLTRSGGQSRFNVQPDSLFDASVEDILWNVDTNTHFRFTQFP